MPEIVDIKTPKKVHKVNEYYISVARRIRVFKYLTLVVLVIFVSVMLLVFRESITYENLQYMLRDFNVASSGAKFSTINFDTDGVSCTEVFRGDILTVGKKNISLYSISGNKLLNQTVSYNAPQVAVSEKYFLTYDTEGETYSVFNSYSKLFSEEFDYAVTDAAVSDSGNYAIVTSTREYPYAVFVYNKDFKRIGEYYKNKYVMDVSLNADGEQLMLLSFYAENGDYRTEILICDTSGKTEDKVITINGRFPMTAEYNENGGFTVVTDGGAYLYSKEAEFLKTVAVNDEILSRAAIGEKSSALFYKKNKNASETSVILFDSDGNVTYNDYVYGKIKDAEIFDDKLYVLLDNSVILIDAKADEQKTASCLSNGRSIVVYSSAIGGSVNAAVAYNASVVTVDFE